MKVFAGHNRKPQEALYVSVGRAVGQVKGCEYQESEEIASNRAVIWADDEDIVIDDYDANLEILKQKFAEYKESGKDYMEPDVYGLEYLDEEDIPETAEELIQLYNEIIEDSYVDRDSAYGASVVDLTTGNVVIAGGVEIDFISEISTYITDAIVSLIRSGGIKEILYNDPIVKKIAGALVKNPEIDHLEDIAILIEDLDETPEQRKEFAAAAAKAAREVGEEDYAIIIENN